MDVLPQATMRVPSAFLVYPSFPSTAVGYVLHKTGRTRPTRFLTCDGPRGWKLGDWLALYGAGRSGEHLGDYQVVGIVRRDNGYYLGENPARLVAHCVEA